MELIIAEKPSAALKIAQSFGKYTKKSLNTVAYYEVPDKNIVIVAAVGHLFGLKKVERYYPTFKLEWKPTWEISKSSAFSKKYFQTMKSIGKKATKYTVATDYDVEGEVIGINIVREMFKKKDANRMKFSTMTMDELQDAYKKKAKTINWPQADAGAVRHNMDWFYGINLSYAISSAVSKHLNRYQPLSIGRVQGPSLAILAERELEIKAFKPIPFWQIFANLWLNSQKIEAVHETEKFWKKPEAHSIFKKVKDQPGKVADLRKRKQKVKVPYPFDLTSLQVESYKLFKYPPSMTLRLAQSLYSHAYISYPRTSSQKLPPALGLKKIIKKLGNQTKYARLTSKVLKTKLKPNEGPKTDPAHPAIFPTGDKPGKLTPQETKMYDLIVKRFLSVFGEPGERESTHVKLEVKGEMFDFTGIVTTKVGWQELYEPYAHKQEIELPQLEIGQVLKQNTAFEEKETQPPSRYSHASIIKKLEKENVGTKATRSHIIDILETRNYIQGSAIQVTDFGLKVCATFKKYAPEILSVKLTREFEEEMNEVYTGKVKPEKLLKTVEKHVTELYNKLKGHSKSIGEALAEQFVQTKRKQAELMVCKNCKKGKIREIRSKKSGKLFAACNNYPKCKTTFPLPQTSKIEKTKRDCKECGFPIIKIIRAKKRPYTMCLNHKCKTKEEWNKSKVKRK